MDHEQHNATHNHQAAPQPQPVAPPPAQPQQVQYVVSERSLHGVGGWLAFWLVIFSILTISGIYSFVTAISGEGSGDTTMQAIFMPLLAIGSGATVVLVAMQKQLGKLVATGTIGVWALYSMISVMTDTDPSKTVALKTASVLANVVLFGLIVLYFWTSKRVKQTLTK